MSGIRKLSFGFTIRTKGSNEAGRKKSGEVKIGEGARHSAGRVRAQYESWLFVQEAAGKTLDDSVCCARFLILRLYRLLEAAQ